MKLKHFIAPAMILAQAAAESNVSSTSDLNGWYPCSDYTFSGAGSSTEDAECAVYSAPLCYPGICETPASVNPKVDIFFKRLPATVGDPSTASNVWLLQGGPGYSSVDLESPMVMLHSQLEGAVNVYMMDHRGTGRSTRLDCVAAQVTTTGSPFGTAIDAFEVAACAEDLHKKYGDLASFSVTTAATDLATFISTYSNGANTFVYGGSYGTVLVERLMHLAPPTVKGYVLDGVATSSGAPADEFMFMSEWDINYGEVGDAFLALCEEDSECKMHFESKSLNNTLEDLIQQFDNDPNSTCATLMHNATAGGDDPPSSTLRSVLGFLLKEASLRRLIPPVVHRLNRCAPEDIEVLDQFIVIANSYMDTSVKTQDEAFKSDLLYYLIVFSEMWESPTPSMSEMEARFQNTRICDGSTASTIPLYCAFAKDTSPACQEVAVSTYDADGIVYKRDQYWNKTATIPSQASVLLLSGTLDTQTSHKYAEYLLNVLDGENKELVAFDYATHGTIVSTQMTAGDIGKETCGMNVLASYVRNDADLKLMDKSCVGEMPGFNLMVSKEDLHMFFSTDDAYDGAYNSSFSSSFGSTSSSY